MSIAFIAHSMILLVTTPYTVKLSVWTGAGGWGCPILVRVFHSCITSLLLMKRAPSSASMAKDITCLSICAILWTMPLFGIKAVKVDMKKCPPVQLYALGSLRYKASTMGGKYHVACSVVIITSGFVAA